MALVDSALEACSHASARCEQPNSCGSLKSFGKLRAQADACLEQAEEASRRHAAAEDDVLRAQLELRECEFRLLTCQLGGAAQALAKSHA